MHATKHTPSARIPNFRVPLAVVTLALVILTCVGIQSVADRFSAARSRQDVAVQALAPAQAAATADDPRLPVGVVIAVLAVVVAFRPVRIRSRVRPLSPISPRMLFWDEMT